MTVIDARLRTAWTDAAVDLRVTPQEVETIVANNLVEIARNPNDSMSAAASLVRRMEAQLAATAPTPAAPTSSRGVSARSGRVTAPTESPERRVARAQLESAQRLLTAVSARATEAQTLLRDTLRQIRIKAAEMRIDGEDEAEILRLMNSVPEHMRPALADTIRRDSQLHADLSWGIDGDNNTKFDAYLDRYSPR